MEHSKYVIGIDIGTSSVKICIINTKNLDIEDEKSEPTMADVTNNSRSNEQDVCKIIHTLQQCMSHFDKDVLKKVIAIGVSGQVHGVVLWNSTNKPWNITAYGEYEIDNNKLSHLYTWQDGRCSTEFLSELPPPDSHLKAYTGYGCNTLFWLSKNEPEKLEQFNCGGTIADFVVCMLCDLEKPLMSNQNSASWGYFNTRTGQWNKSILESAKFPMRFLPNVSQPEEIAGCLRHNWCNIYHDTPVGVALGDLQCSVLATLENHDDAFVNISTSAQLAFIEPNFQPELIKDYPMEYVVPYYDEKYLAVAALLNGGNALATFVRSVQLWFSEIGIDVNIDTLWNRLMELSTNNQLGDNVALCINPLFLGERYDPDRRASISNITSENFNLSQMFKAFCIGIIENMHRITPREMLVNAGIKRIVAGGSALVRNVHLQHELANVYKLPLILNSSRDSSYGAAISVLRTLRTS